MAINNKLKAYVRYDGTGRLISGSLILQRFKPKVGDWKEINAYECCNYSPTTTTTTSSSTSTSSTTTTTTTTTTALVTGNVTLDVFQLTDGVCGAEIITNYNVTITQFVTVGKWYTDGSGTQAIHIISAGGPGGGDAGGFVNERDTCAI